MGQSSVKGPIPSKTAAFTIAIPYPTIVKATSTVVVTPATSTVTSTSTITSTITSVQSAMTDTFTLTITPSTTISTDTTTTTTSASTTTSMVLVTPTAATITINPPAQFTPLGQQLAAQNDDYSRKKRSMKDADLLHDRSSPEIVDIQGQSQLGKRSRNVSKLKERTYPQSVQCNKLVEEIVLEVITVPSRQRKTITAKAPTSTLTTSTVITSTYTMIPSDVSTTKTSTLSTTSTITSTSTTTVTVYPTITQTSTSVLAPPPAVTYYPGCQSNNVITLIGGANINGFRDYQSSQIPYTVTSAQSGLECCQMCQLNANIDPSICPYYYWSYTQSVCTMASNPASPDAYQIFTSSFERIKIPDQMGNGAAGLCGMVEFGT